MMTVKKLLPAATLAVLAVAGTIAMPHDANAWWRGGWGVGVYAPPVYVAPPPVYVVPAPVYVAPPPVVYAPPPRRYWIPPHWEGPYWVQGHWS